MHQLTNKLDAIIINIIIPIIIIMSSKASYIELNIFFIIIYLFFCPQNFSQI